MDIQEPELEEGSIRRYFSNDGTPNIVDYTEDGDPVGAYRLGTQDGGFIWRPLEGELLLELYNEGREVHDMDEFDEVVEAFVETRMPGGDQEIGLGA